MTTPRRALVTGADGFTGIYMVQELERAGYTVHGLTRSAQARQGLNHAADLCDPAAVNAVVQRVRPHVVVHLAGMAFVAHGQTDEIYRVNLLGTLSLLQALGQLPQAPECVLLASSGNVYGNAHTGRLDETMVPAPANDYAVSKLAMEQMARLWLPRLPIVIARPFNYTGVGQSELFVLPKIVAHIRQKARIIRLGNIAVWRDFGDVRSVVQAYAGLLQTRPVGEVVNVCTGQPTSLQEVLSLLTELSGHHLRVLADPALIRANEVPTLYGNPGRLQALLPHWRPIALADTLRWMLGVRSCNDASQPF